MTSSSLNRASTVAAEALTPLASALEELGATASVDAVDASEGTVRVAYAGPPKLQRVVELALRGSDAISRVEFVEGASGASAVSPPVPAVPRRFASERRFKSRETASARTAAADPLATLHSAGYVLLELGGAALIDAETVGAIRGGTSFEPIFNGQPEGEAPLRLMGRNPVWARPVEEAFTRVLRDIGALECSDGSTKTVNDCYALRSLPAPAHEGGVDDDNVAKDAAAIARAGRQPPHSDSPEPPVGSLSQLADAGIPLSAMLAVEPETRLWLFPNGCPGAREAAPAGDAIAAAMDGEPDADGAVLVDIPVGAVLVWRGDLVHAGAGYAVDHIRIHAYVDPPPSIYERPRGKTNRCGV